MRLSVLARLLDSLLSVGIEQKARHRIAKRDAALARSVASRFSRGNVLVQNERFETEDSFEAKLSSVKKKTRALPH